MGMESKPLVPTYTVVRIISQVALSHQSRAIAVEMALLGLTGESTEGIDSGVSDRAGIG